MPDQILDAVALIAGVDEVFSFAARKKFLDRGRPVVTRGCREFQRMNAAGCGVLSQRCAGPAVELESGLLERSGNLIQLVRGRQRETIVQQAHREPYDQTQRRESGGYAGPEHAA